MRSGFLMAVASVLLLFVASAGARIGDWQPFSVHERQGAIEATLTYEAAPGLVGVPVFRHATLVVRRAGMLAIRYEIRGGVLGNQPGGLLYETPAPRLRLVDVWGDSVPEAMVEYSSGGQGCCWITDVVILVGSHGHLLTHTFETSGVDSQRYQGQFQFVTRDERFVCVFSTCPDSTFPIQVLAIDPTGRRFIDVTRTRRQAIEAQAGVIWKAYLHDRAHPPSVSSQGELAAWCADQYLLGRKERCHRIVRQAVARGYLPGPAQGFIDYLDLHLRAWGYD